jgi:hypothetical protein
LSWIMAKTGSVKDTLGCIRSKNARTGVIGRPGLLKDAVRVFRTKMLQRDLHGTFLDSQCPDIRSSLAL